MNLNFINTLDLKSGGTVIILCGPPGSGKSTMANTIVDNFDNFKIIAPDKIREDITGDASSQSHNDVVFSKVYSLLVTYLCDGYNVVYDATNCRSAYRHKIINVVKDYADYIICLMSTTPISECIKRNEERNRHVPESVIEKMYFTLRKHPPVIFEGFDMIASF